MTSLYDGRDLERLRVLMDKVGNAACAAHQYQLALNDARYQLEKFVEELLSEPRP